MAMTDISALATMLNPKEEDSDSDTDCVKYTPADVGSRKSKSKIPDVSVLYSKMCVLLLNYPGS